MRSSLHNLPKRLRIVLLGGVIALGGCSSIDDVELEVPFFGKISTSTKAKTPKVATRAPLVLPPKTQLPPPGPAEPVPGAAVQTAGALGPQSWPKDPDVAKRRELAKLEAKKKGRRKNLGWSKKGGIDEFEKSVDPATSLPSVGEAIWGEGELSDAYRDEDAPTGPR